MRVSRTPHVSQAGMDDTMNIQHTNLLHAANDLERIGDHISDLPQGKLV